MNIYNVQSRAEDNKLNQLHKYVHMFCSIQQTRKIGFIFYIVFLVYIKGNIFHSRLYRNCLQFLSLLLALTAILWSSSRTKMRSYLTDMMMNGTFVVLQFCQRISQFQNFPRRPHQRNKKNPLDYNVSIKISLEPKIRMYNCYAISVLLYGSKFLTEEEVI